MQSFQQILYELMNFNIRVRESAPLRLKLGIQQLENTLPVIECFSDILSNLSQ